MKEYIEKDAARDLMERALEDDWEIQYANDRLRDIPIADVVEVRHAYWRDIQPPDQDNNVQCWCSACGAGELHADGMIVPYCWKCGSKMDGGGDK